MRATPHGPTEALDGLVYSEQEMHQVFVAKAVDIVAAAGMSRIDDQLYVLDLGTCTRSFPVAPDTERQHGRRVQQAAPLHSSEIGDMRATAQRHRSDIEAYVRDESTRLRCMGNKTTREAARSDIDAKLASRSMRSVCMPTITDVCTGDHQHPVVSLRFDEDAWNKRRAYDGFVLLGARPELPHIAQELIAVVRAKDAPSQRGPANDCSRDLRAFGRWMLEHDCVRVGREHQLRAHHPLRTAAGAPLSHADRASG